MLGTKAIGVALMVFGVLLFVLGIVMGPWLASYLNGRFKKAGEGACAAKDLTKPSFLDPYSDCEDCHPLHFGYHPFHVSNAEQHLQDPVSTKPVLEEKGPYFYRKREIRVDAELKDGFASFKAYNKWTFDESMSTGKETDIITKMDLGYLAVTTSTGGELNFVNSLLAALMAMRGQAFDASRVPSVVKANFMRLINGLNSFDPATMLSVVSELAPLFNAQTDVAAYMAGLAGKEFTGFNYNGLLSKRTVRKWFMGHPSFIAGLAIGSQYPACAAPMEAAGGLSMLEVCEGCEGAACHQHWQACSTCRKASAVKAGSEALCDELEGQLEEALGAERAAMVVGATCRLCTSASLFCLAQLPGEVETSGIDYNVAPVEKSRLGAYTVDQGCSDVGTRGHHTQYDSSFATPVWTQLAQGQSMPTVFDLLQFAGQSWCDSDVQPGVTCLPFPGTYSPAFQPAGVTIAGLEEEPAFDRHEVFVSQAMINVTLFPGEEVETKGIRLVRLTASESALDRVPWNEAVGVGFPVDGVQCAAFRKGFLAFVSRPMYLYADKTLLEDIELVTRRGQRVSPDTPDASLIADYETYADVETASGIAMRVRKRLMGSVALTTEAVPGSTLSTANLVHPTMPANVLLPVYWVEERAEISDSRADSFKDTVRLSEAMAPVCGVGVGLGVLCCALAALILARAFRRPPAASEGSETGSDAQKRDVETVAQPAASLSAASVLKPEFEPEPTILVAQATYTQAFPATTQALPAHLAFPMPGPGQAHFMAAGPFASAPGPSYHGPPTPTVLTHPSHVMLASGRTR